ncbi:MAG: matrixin family metalloprotease [Bacteroidota bacterium]
MKKLIGISLLMVGIVFMLSVPALLDTHKNSNGIKNNRTENVQHSQDEAEKMIKQLALSVITPHLEESLKQSIVATGMNSEYSYGLPATCFAPDTDPKVIEDFYRMRTILENSLGLPNSSQGSRFNIGNRWFTTASDGGGLGQGDFTTLTWSYVPDGTPIGNGGCGVPGESTDPSNFIAFFNGVFGGPTVSGDYTTAPWHAIFVNMFSSWSAASGLTFVYEPNDDGATVVTGGAGIVGTRGDFRISGHRLDGNSGVLACNYFPQNGDMIIDTDDNFYANNPGLGTSNVLTHEIGHGLGIFHVCPVQQTKLMEPFISTAFNGPQEDDILATNRHYGDPDGSNDDTASAVFLGNTGNPVSYNRTQRSIDDNSEVDYFSFTINESSSLNGTLTPTGTQYLSGVQNGDGSCSAGSSFNALAVSDLMFEILDTDGVSVLATGNANGAGLSENLMDIILPTAGTYYVRVSQQGSAVDNVQMYDLDVSLVAAVTTPEISFAAITGNGAENTDCAFTDFSVDLNIGAGASADADITFSIDGASTALQGSDFDLMTSGVTFPAGSTAPQQMTLRVYHDAFIEGDDTIIVNTSLNANGGDATLNPALDTYTFTITNDDFAPVATQLSTLFSEDFESYADFDIGNVGSWTMFDGDGDSTYGSTTYDFTNENYTGTFIVFNPSQTTPSAAGTDWDPHGGDKGYYCFNESIAP